MVKPIRKEVEIPFDNHEGNPIINLLLYIPSEAEEPVPTFVGLNFHGNHTIHLDPEIKLPEQWVNNNQELGIKNNRATEQSRGSNSSRWPVENIVSRGYALATIYCGDMDPDFHDGFQNGMMGFKTEYILYFIKLVKHNQLPTNGEPLVLGRGGLAVPWIILKLIKVLTINR